MRILVLGAGYLGAKAAELALDRGDEVVLADNWYATDRGQLAPLEVRGARITTVDIRDRGQLHMVLRERPDRVLVLAAQASRPLAEVEPDYTEATNLTGARRIAEAVAQLDGLPVAYASSLNVYGPSLSGEIGPHHPFGPQGDLAHLSKIYAELCLDLFARRHEFPLGNFRLGILYGPSIVEHSRTESQTVVDKFRRLAASGEQLVVDPEAGTIGVAHVEDAARILLDAPLDGPVNVAAESVTVADLAALAQGREPAGGASCTFTTPFEYRHRVADYLRDCVAA
jgi:nucleoside-diphosphate-sugar epimerase